MCTQLLALVVMVLQSFLGGFGTTLPPTVSEAPYVPGTSLTATVTKVVDGDTIEVRLSSSTKVTRVRYIGIDTPELYLKNSHVPECGAKAARDANSRLVKNATVTLVVDADPLDSYGRLLAYVYVGDTFVNEELLRQGHATTLTIKPNTRFRTKFARVRAEAQTAQVGIWDYCLD